MPEIKAPEVEVAKPDPLQAAPPKPVSAGPDPLAPSAQARQQTPSAWAEPLTERQETARIRAHNDRLQKDAELRSKQTLETHKLLQQRDRQRQEAYHDDLRARAAAEEAEWDRLVGKTEAPKPRKQQVQPPATTSETSRRPLKVDRALDGALPPVREDPASKWDGASHPGRDAIAEARRKPVAERSYGDQSKLLWDDRYWTDDGIQQETDEFFKLNSSDVESRGPGHSQASAKFGREGIDEENRLINRHRADEAVGRLGSNPDPDHVRLIEEHYGLREPSPQSDTPEWRQDKFIDTGKHTITVDWNETPEPSVWDDMRGLEAPVDGPGAKPAADGPTEVGPPVSMDERGQWYDAQNNPVPAPRDPDLHRTAGAAPVPGMLPGPPPMTPEGHRSWQEQSQVIGRKIEKWGQESVEKFKGWVDGTFGGSAGDREGGTLYEMPRMDLPDDRVPSGPPPSEATPLPQDHGIETYPADPPGRDDGMIVDEPTPPIDTQTPGRAIHETKPEDTYVTMDTPEDTGFFNGQQGKQRQREFEAYLNSDQAKKDREWLQEAQTSKAKDHVPPFGKAWEMMPRHHKNNSMIDKRHARTNGLTGKKKRYYVWDSKHGEIEVHDSNGRHLGAVDPITLEPKPDKTRNPIYDLKREKISEADRPDRPTYV